VLRFIGGQIYREILEEAPPYRIINWLFLTRCSRKIFSKNKKPDTKVGFRIERYIRFLANARNLVRLQF